jgi:hypothetical protein
VSFQASKSLCTTPGGNVGCELRVGVSPFDESGIIFFRAFAAAKGIRVITSDRRRPKGRRRIVPAEACRYGVNPTPEIHHFYLAISRLGQRMAQPSWYPLLMKKPNSVKNGRRLKLVPPPPGVIEQLETAARGNLQAARRTIGLFDTIVGDSDATLFPKYRWRPGELRESPDPVARAARSLLNWGIQPGAVLNEILSSRISVAKHVTDLRRNSPFGRSCLKEVRGLRKEYPVLSRAKPSCPAPLAKSFGLSVLDNLVGEPLNARALRFVIALAPQQTQILGAEDPLAWGLPPGTATIGLAGDGYTIDSITLTMEVQTAPPIGGKIRGQLIDFCEAGTEGLVWAVMDDVSTGYDALHTIDEGDHLRITDPLGNKLWSGTISCDREAGWRKYARNPKYGQPSALGYRIHWTQSGFTPDDWTRFFVRPSYDRCRCLLTRKSSSRPNKPEAL